MTQKRDRAAKVATLLAALRKAKDRDALPLLISLRRRSLIAAQTPDALEIASRFLGDPAPEVREVAVKTLASLFDADYLRQGESRERAVKRLVAALDAAGADVSLRVAAFDALGAAAVAGRPGEPASPGCGPTGPPRHSPSTRRGSAPSAVAVGSTSARLSRCSSINSRSMRLPRSRSPRAVPTRCPRPQRGRAKTREATGDQVGIRAGNRLGDYADRRAEGRRRRTHSPRSFLASRGPRRTSCLRHGLRQGRRPPPRPHAGEGCSTRATRTSAGKRAKR